MSKDMDGRSMLRPYGRIHLKEMWKKAWKSGKVGERGEMTKKRRMFTNLFC